MSDNKGKEFRISHVFKNLSSLPYHEDLYGDVVEHFGAKWRIGVFKDIEDYITPELFCEGSPTGNWSINTVYDVLVGGIPYGTGTRFEFNQNHEDSWVNYIPKNDYSKYGINENITIEFRVKIIEDDSAKKSSKIEKWQKSMNFDDDVAKKSSDVVLNVGDQKFYVCKMYLSFHSTYFESLFSGNFSESQRSEIELKDIDPDVFQYFLELIYGISLLDDTMIMEILKLADFFDAKTVIERCQEFLLNRSEQPLKIKFQAALKYKMEKLKIRKVEN